MKSIKTYLPIIFVFVFMLMSYDAKAQFKIKFDEEGNQWLRVISWHQMWHQTKNLGEDNQASNFLMRRSRILFAGQLSKDFMFVTHFGYNSASATNQHPTGKNDNVQLFMHDAWMQYNVFRSESGSHLDIGTGLHYWNGISRLTNQSTLNLMTIDAPRFNWPALGLSDQFARHLGIFAKGKAGKLWYQFAFNEANEASLNSISGLASGASYVGRQVSRLNGDEDQKGKWNYAGYLQYEIGDAEGDYFPYRVGTYLGNQTKKIFNIGAGFFYHPDGVVESGTLELSGSDVTAVNNAVYKDVLLLGADIYYDAPIGEDGSAINLLLTYYNYDFGKNYTLGNLIGTGNIYYAQAGYLLPKFSESKHRLMPYVTYDFRDFEGLKNADGSDATASRIIAGAKWFLSGHNFSLAAEYINNKVGDLDAVAELRIQAMVFLW